MKVEDVVTQVQDQGLPSRSKKTGPAGAAPWREGLSSGSHKIDTVTARDDTQNRGKGRGILWIFPFFCSPVMPIGLIYQKVREKGDLGNVVLCSTQQSRRKKGMTPRANRQMTSTFK